MEEFVLILVFLGVVAVMVLWMWMKAFKSPASPTDPRARAPKANPTPLPPATSFQDILKEMQASGERAQNAKQPAPRTFTENSRPTEKVNIPAKSLERTTVAPKSLEKLPALERKAVKYSSTIEQARTAKTNPVGPINPAVNYGRLLRNPQNVRAAFVLSEVFNRKFDY